MRSGRKYDREGSRRGLRIIVESYPLHDISHSGIFIEEVTIVLYQVKSMFDQAKCSAQPLMVVTAREKNRQICAKSENRHLESIDVIGEHTVRIM